MMDVETADHNHKETQNCSMVLDKSRKIEAADHNHKETQNYSMVLDENKKVETHPLENHFGVLTRFTDGFLTLGFLVAFGVLGSGK